MCAAIILLTDTDWRNGELDNNDLDCDADSEGKDTNGVGFILSTFYDTHFLLFQQDIEWSLSMMSSSSLNSSVFVRFDLWD